MVLPNGRAQLVVDLDAGTALLVGPRTTSVQVQVPVNTAGVALTAVGLQRVADIPAHELVDQVVDVDELWGDRRWLRHLEQARSEEDLLSHLEEEVVHHLRPRAPDPRVVATERAIRTGTEPGAIATAVGADRRWLVPEFRRVVGVAPKHYQRITRFQALLRALRAADSAPLRPSLPASATQIKHTCVESSSRWRVSSRATSTAIRPAVPTIWSRKWARPEPSLRRRGSSR